MHELQRQYIDILNNSFLEKKKLNCTFSLRAFAKYISISPTGLSLILNGKRPLTTTKASEILFKLKLNDELESQFVDAVEKFEYYRLNETEKKERELENTLNYEEINQSDFNLIDEWYHLVILNLTALKDFNSDPEWIAGVLGISNAAATDAICKLLQLGLLEKNDNGVLLRNSKPISISSLTSSESIQYYHEQNITRAIKSIKAVPVDQRDISSIIMPINKEKMGEAKKMIQNFTRELASFLKDGSEYEDVYSLNVQFFPQTRMDQ